MFHCKVSVATEKVYMLMSPRKVFGQTMTTSRALRMSRIREGLCWYHETVQSPYDVFCIHIQGGPKMKATTKLSKNRIKSQ